MAESKRLLRVSMMVRRKNGTSEEEFSKYWTEKHAPLVREWLAKHGVLKYTQYHTPPSLQSAVSQTLSHLSSSSTSLPYDGTVEFLVPDVSVLAAAWEDSYYKDTVAADEAKFFEKDDVQWTVGWEEVYVKNGKVVNLKFADKQGWKVGDSHYVEDVGGDEGLGAEHHAERL